jgi:hypothetical protein
MAVEYKVISWTFRMQSDGLVYRMQNQDGDCVKCDEIIILSNYN